VSKLFRKITNSLSLRLSLSLGIHSEAEKTKTNASEKNAERKKNRPAAQKQEEARKISLFLFPNGKITLLRKKKKIAQTGARFSNNNVLSRLVLNSIGGVERIVDTQ